MQGDAVDVLLNGLLAGRAQLRGCISGPAEPDRPARVVAACAVLRVHLHIEAALFYPALREQVDDGRAIDQAEVGLEALRDQIDRLAIAAPDSPWFEARLVVLAQWLDLHLHRDLSVLFPMACHSALPLAELGSTLAQARDALCAELARGEQPSYEDEAADPVGVAPH